MLEIMRGPFVSSRSDDSATARPKFHLLQGFGRRPPPLLGDNLGANTSSHRHASLATMRMYLLLVIAADALRLPAAPYISQDCNAGRRAPRAPARPPRRAPAKVDTSATSVFSKGPCGGPGVPWRPLAERSLRYPS